MGKNNQIRASRERLKLSQSDLAQTLGVTTAALSKWESGISKPSKVHQAVLKRLEEKAESENIRDTIIGFTVAGGVMAFLAWLWSENNKK